MSLEKHLGALAKVRVTREIILLSVVVASTSAEVGESRASRHEIRKLTSLSMSRVWS